MNVSKLRDENHVHASSHDVFINVFKHKILVVKNDDFTEFKHKEKSISLSPLNAMYKINYKITDKAMIHICGHVISMSCGVQ